MPWDATATVTALRGVHKHLVAAREGLNGLDVSAEAPDFIREAHERASWALGDLMARVERAISAVEEKLAAMEKPRPPATHLLQRSGDDADGLYHLVALATKKTPESCGAEPQGPSAPLHLAGTLKLCPKCREALAGPAAVDGANLLGEPPFHLKDGRGPFMDLQSAFDELGVDKADRPHHNRWPRLSRHFKGLIIPAR